MTTKLAMNGGEPTIRTPLRPYRSIGLEEKEAVAEVMETGRLSEFVGAPGSNFLGGPKVRQFEAACEVFFETKHAIAVNSWTSGLIAAVGAVGVRPGDEVIVPPWTMTASAAAVLHWNAIPVFADIRKDTFCLDPESVEAAISEKTRAIIAVDIFGQSADIAALMELAESHDLVVISDTAQAPAARVNGRFAGTSAHIGGISLNYHKHINTGEGGVLFTDDDQLAHRMRLIRNHGEAVVNPDSIKDLVNIIGHNFRLGELEAAIGIEQLKKLPGVVERRERIGNRLLEGLAGLSGLKLPIVAKGNTHVYYIFGMTLEGIALEIGREQIVRALRAEGVPGLGEGYANIHLLPIYQQKIAYGDKGFPWTETGSEVSYAKGICPVAEELHSESFLGFLMCLFELNDEEVDAVILAFRKVWENLVQVEDSVS